MDNERLHVERLTKFGKLTWMPFEAVIGLLMILTGFVRIATPHVRWIPDAPIVISYLVGAIFGVGGLLILYGLWRSKLKAEALGLIASIIGVIITTVASFLFHDVSALTNVASFFIVNFGVATRLRMIFTGRRMIMVKPDEGADQWAGR